MKMAKKVLNIVGIPFLVISMLMTSFSSVVASAESASFVKLLTPGPIILEVGGTQQLNWDTTPVGADVGSLAFKSGNSSVASVSGSGLIAAAGAGTTDISVSATNRLGIVSTDKISVKVIPLASSVQITKPVVELKQNESYQFSANVYPAEAVQDKLTWRVLGDRGTGEIGQDSGLFTVKSITDHSGTATFVVSAETANGKVGYATVTASMDIPVTGIAVEPFMANDTYTVWEGETVNCRFSVSPDTASNQKLTYILGDDSIALISGDDFSKNIYGKKAGTTTLKITSSDKTEKTIQIVVVKKVTSILLNHSYLSLKKGDEAQLTAFANPGSEAIQNAEVIWKTQSGNEDVIAVSNGKIIALKDGSEKVIAGYKVNGNWYYAYCTVVIHSVSPFIYVEDSYFNMDIGGKQMMNIKTKPDTESLDCTYTTSDNQVAIVSATGEITAVGAGKATITAIAGNSTSAACHVNVYKELTDVSMSESSIRINTGDQFLLNTTLSGKGINGSLYSISYHSKDTAIAEVGKQTGVITGVAKGKTEVNVVVKKGTDTLFTKVCLVEVSEPITEIRIDSPSQNMFVGDCADVLYTVLPATASGQIKWHSSDEDIVTVKNGQLAATKKGSAIITAKGGNGIIAIMIVNVEVKPTSIDISRHNVETFVGVPVNLSAHVSPKGADQKVQWESSAPDLIICGNGNIVASVSGTYEVTASAGTGADKISDTCRIVVLDRTAAITPSRSSVDMYLGDSTTVDVDITAAGPAASLSWSTSDTNVITVDKNGVIKAVGEGIAFAAATTSNGYVALIKINVTKAAVNLSLDTDHKSVYPGGSFDIKATVTPADATNQEIDWSSANGLVARVNQNGHVTAFKSGITVISATLGSITRTCTVIVKIPVTGIAFAASDIKLNVGQTYDMGTVFTPANAADQNLNWSSENDAIATVDAYGHIKAKAPGIIEIYATTYNGLRALARLEVVQLEKGVLLDVKSCELYPNEKLPIHATVFPYDASNQELTWHSDNNDVAEYKNGNIIANGPGKCEIKVISALGFESICEVTVKQPVTGVEINDGSSVAKYVGDVFKLSAAVIPSNAFDHSLTWYSLNEEIASVKNGIVSFHQVGTTTVYACSYNGIEKACEIVVLPKASLEIAPKSYQLYPGDSFMLNAAIDPANGYDSLVWESLDPSVAVISNGVVKAVAPGTTKISVSYSDGIKKIEKFCDIEVLTPIEEIGFETASRMIEVGESFNLASILFIHPVEASNQYVKWESGDASVVTVDSYGRIRGQSAGTADIYVSTYNHLRAVVEITVTQKAQGIIFDKYDISLYPEEKTAIKATVLPESATDKTVTWKSSNDGVAKYSNGNIIAVSPGKCTIIAETVNGETAVCDVFVKTPADAVTISGPAEFEGYVGYTDILIATVTPNDAYNKTVTWHSSDSNMASIDNNGVITYKCPGVVKVYAETVNGKRAYVTINVIIPVHNVIIDKTHIELYPNQAAQINATIEDENASVKSLAWYSSDQEVVTVDSYGRIQAVAPGKAEVSVTAYGNITKVCTVIVKTPLNALEFTEKSMQLYVNDFATLVPVFGPENAADKTLEWKSSNPDVISVDQYGKIIALAPGSAFIYATSYNGLRAECYVNSIRLAESVKVTPETMKMYPGEAKTVKATILPEDTTDKSVTWRSSNEKIAYYHNGKVIAVAPGKAHIIATTVNGKTSACIVEVLIPVKSVQFSKSSLTKYVGDKFALKYTINPSNAANKTLKWKSSNPKIATVDQYGNVKCIKVGFVTITATAHNGVKAICYLTVLKKGYVSRRGTVTASILYIRTQPSLKGLILGHFVKGNRVTVTNKVGLWYQIKYKGKTAYVHASYVKLDGVSTSNTSSAKGTNAKVANISVAKIYAAPNGKYSTNAPKGTRLLVLGKSGSYYKISYGTKKKGIGYIRTAYVKLDTGAKYGVPTK